MAQPFNYEIKGLDKLMRSLEKKAHLTQEIAGEFHATAIEITNAAASKAPVDTGVLKRSLHFKKLGPLHYEIVSGARYSAYVEFGTGSGVRVPKGVQSYAIQFKGKGIKRINKQAKPFLFPAVKDRTEKLVNRIKKILGKW